MPKSTSDISACLAQAIACQEHKQFTDAIGLLQQLLQIDPAHAEAHTRLGWMLWETGNPAAAVEAHRTAIRIAPDFAGAWSNLAVALQSQGDYDAALHALEQAVALAPENPEAHVNLGINSLGRGLPSLAITAFRNALKLNPALLEAWINLGLAFQECGNMPACISAYKQALQINAGDLRTWSNLQIALQYTPEATAAALREQAAIVGAHFVNTQPMPATNRHGRRLRIGYVSADFYAHPVGWLGIKTLCAHNRERVEVFCYSDCRIADQITLEFRDSLEHWFETRQLNNQQLRELIVSHEIDVLVDLAGHTTDNRLAMFGLQAAQVQVSWLGYTASSGLSTMNAALMADVQAATGVQTGFVEPVITLPRCHFTYRPPDYAPPITAKPVAEKSAIILGCFNNPAKLNREVLATWAEIMHRLPESLLILKWRSLTDPVIAANLQQQFAQLGIAAERIILRGASPHAEMLAEYAELDIALDPFPFCGGLTTCEALWMGVPVVTLPWLRPVSRQGYAILDAIGLNDLVAFTPRNYVDTVCKLANDTARLGHLRNNLREMIRRSPLFDGASLALALEDIYLKLADTGVEND